MKSFIFILTFFSSSLVYATCSPSCDSDTQRCSGSTEFLGCSNRPVPAPNLKAFNQLPLAGFTIPGVAGRPGRYSCTGFASKAAVSVPTINKLPHTFNYHGLQITVNSMRFGGRSFGSFTENYARTRTVYACVSK